MPSDKQKIGHGRKGPYLVVEKIGDMSYRAHEHQQSRKITLHVNHIKAFEQMWKCKQICNCLVITFIGDTKM